MYHLIERNQRIEYRYSGKEIRILYLAKIFIHKKFERMTVKLILKFEFFCSYKILKLGISVYDWSNEKCFGLTKV
jgi:hypothetical protein